MTVTPKLKAQMLEMLEEFPNYSQVRKMLGFSSDAFYRARNKDPEWDRALKRARAEGYENLEAEAYRRAVQGVVEPVFYKGEPVMGADGQPVGIRRYSDKLLETMLKACKPTKFNPGAKVRVDADDKLKFVINMRPDND